MSNLQGSINSIIPLSFVDGPSARFVIFMQGCNMSCPTCHNPQTRGHCVGCGTCVPVCKSDALRFDHLHQAAIKDVTKCKHCKSCLRACPHSADPGAVHLSILELILAIERAEPFIAGITVSGGEALLQALFLEELFKSIKNHPALNRLSILVDTNGSIVKELWERLVPLMDGVMVDLKATSAEKHRAFTNADLSLVKRNIKAFYDIDLLYEVRILIVPGLNDLQSELDEYSQFLCSVDPHIPVKLLQCKFHFPLRGSDFKAKEPSQEQMQEIQNSFLLKGLKNVSIQSRP